MFGRGRAGRSGATALQAVKVEKGKMRLLSRSVTAQVSGNALV
jgi:hypothetical protein